MNFRLGNKKDHNFGISFNGRLSPYSDLVDCNYNNINILVHERGWIDSLMNMRLNRKALDQQEFIYLIDEYIKIWEPDNYPTICNKLQEEHIGQGNLTSRIWKNAAKKYSKTAIKEDNKKELVVALFLSSTDEAYNDCGTLLLEAQYFTKKYVKTKKRRFY